MFLIKQMVLRNAFFMFLLLTLPLTGFAAPSSFPHPLKKRPTVCLNMIVKNENHVITRCLDSVLPIIDYYVICDTGSTDGTQETIKAYMEEHGIPGELHQHEWVNFGHNREEALRLAKYKADYVFFMDADDILSFDDDFKLPNLQHDSYLIKSSAGQTRYMLTRLIKSSVDWHWYGVLHEYIFTEHAGQSLELLGVEYIYICDGARSKDPEKYLKDAKILHDALEKEPDNARYMFYLAQTYVSGGELEKGLKYYQNRIEMEGWDQEVFWSMLQAAQLQGALGFDFESVEKSFLKALRFRPSRVEPYFFLVREARQKTDYQKGYEIGKAAINLPVTKDILFVEMKTYDALLLEFSLCAWWSGHYEESLQASEKLLAKKNIHPEIKPYAIEVKEAALAKLKENALNDEIDSIFSSLGDTDLVSVH